MTRDGREVSKFLYEFMKKSLIFEDFVPKFTKYANKMENRQIMHFMQIKAFYAQKSLFTKTPISIYEQ